MDRAALSVAMPFMTRDFHLSASERGVVFNSFFVRHLFDEWRYLDTAAR
ncbi:hypothetical protein [Paraburkholderia fungorum]